MTDIVIAGLSVAGFNALSAVSSRRIAPLGELFARPVKRLGYPKEHARQYQEELRDRILKLPETALVSLTLLYVDYADATTAAFLNAFRPFALVRAIAPVAENEKGRITGAAMRSYGEYLAAEALELRSRASRVSEFTHIRNVSPYLLPVRNFNSRHHRRMLTRLFDQLGTTPDISTLMRTEANNLARHHPRLTPPGQNDSCFSDGRLYFRSPGRARHGFFRHEMAKGHQPACLLAARSRFGGSYAHDLHYDCRPVVQLATNYPNCHGATTTPNAEHVNICPNDYVI